MAESIEGQESEYELGGPRFDPPLYRQRYQFVQSLCKRLQPTSVVDMGCAECKLLKLLVKEESVKEMAGVDIQASLLKANSHHLQPLISDFVIRRPAPLTIRLYQGSIVESDSRLKDFDLLTCVEVIEHLDPPVLDQVPRVVFGELQPKVAIFTTPNSEFNVLFPDFHGFRHPDHRFEWTRSEFQHWCDAVCFRYSQYTVEYSGVGMPPSSCTDDVGPCSQIAIFTRQGSASALNIDKYPFNVVMECDYPYQTPLSVEERLRNEVEYCLLQLLKWGDQEIVEEGEIDEESVKLDTLLQYQSIRELCSNSKDIIKVLEQLTIVKRVEGERIVVDHSHWESESSLNEEEEEEKREELEDILVRTLDNVDEQWD